MIIQAEEAIANSEIIQIRKNEHFRNIMRIQTDPKIKEDTNKISKYLYALMHELNRVNLNKDSELSK